MEGRLQLVDDDPGVLDLLNDYFAGQGYDVEVVSSGEAALSAVRAKRPDLVLLDIRMPGSDGVEVLRRLRRPDATLPGVRVTAHEDVALARETLHVGAFDYGAKPFDFIGYRELGAHLRGEIALEAAQAAIQQGTRQYAKRQITWFRRELEVHWLPGFGDDPQTMSAARSLLAPRLGRLVRS